MRRREFIFGLGGVAVASPIATHAQQQDGVRRIGVLMTQAANDPEAQARLKAFREGLAALGWIEGRNIRMEYRFAEGQTERTRAHVAELVGQAPDVLLANGRAITAAFREQTRTIPIVFVLVPDPLGDGFVESLARPGGNVTGFSNYEPAMGTKWLELLKEIAPRVTRIAILFNPTTAPYAKSFSQAIEAAPAPYRIDLTSVPVRNPREIEQAIATFANQVDVGLMVVPDLFTAGYHELIATLAATHRMPGVYPFRYFVNKGGLVSYGVVTDDLFRRSASYVDSILRGAKPADLPVQTPTKFELVINLKTAKTLGLTIPPTLLVRADEVIE